MREVFAPERKPEKWFVELSLGSESSKNGTGSFRAEAKDAKI